MYFPKAVCDAAFAFETNSEPGQLIPMHIHPNQEEFILVQEGELNLKLDGEWVKAGDLARMSRGISHGCFNKSDKPTKALFWVLPVGILEEFLNKLDNLTNSAEVVKVLAQYEVNFLSPKANDYAARFHVGTCLTRAAWVACERSLRPCKTKQQGKERRSKRRKSASLAST